MILARLYVWLALASLLRPATASASEDGEWVDYPPPRRLSMHAAVYDPIRDRFIVFGGLTSSAGGDDQVWTFSPATGLWSRATPAGTAPSARRDHTLVYDQVSDRVLLYGGWNRGQLLGDAWELSLSGVMTWRQVVPDGQGPLPRCEHAAVFDPVRNRMLVFGGFHGARTNELWELSLGGAPRWTQLSTSELPPAPRHSMTATYDGRRNEMIVFGGWSGNSPSSETWSLSLASDPPVWNLLSVSSSPPARKDHGAAYDHVGDRIIVAAGVGSSVLADVWTFDLSRRTWAEVRPSSSLPPARRDAATAYDPSRGHFWMFGGFDGGTVAPLWKLDAGFFLDAWSLELGARPAWKAMEPERLPPTQGRYGLVLDPVTDAIYTVGGPNSAGPIADLWRLSAGNPYDWMALAPAGSSPGARGHHTTTLDPVGRRILLFGGWGPGNQVFNDLWEIPLDGAPSWNALRPEGELPHERTSHVAVYDSAAGQVIVYGGSYHEDWVGTVVLGDLWSLTLDSTLRWTRLSPAGEIPEGRAEASAIYDPPNRRVIVFGGWVAVPPYGLRYTDEVWELSLAAHPTWRRLQPDGQGPGPRRSAGMVHDPIGHRAVVFGGTDDTGWLGDVWELGLAGSPAWRRLDPRGQEEPLSRPALYDPKRDQVLLFWNDMSVRVLKWNRVPRNESPRVETDLVSLSPNPGAGPVTLRFHIQSAARVRVAVHDIAGRLIKVVLDADVAAGEGRAVWSGSLSSGDLAPAGVYLMRIELGERVWTRKVVRL